MFFFLTILLLYLTFPHKQSSSQYSFPIILFSFFSCCCSSLFLTPFTSFKGSMTHFLHTFPPPSNSAIFHHHNDLITHLTRSFSHSNTPCSPTLSSPNFAPPLLPSSNQLPLFHEESIYLRFHSSWNPSICFQLIFPVHHTAFSQSNEVISINPAPPYPSP